MESSGHFGKKSLLEVLSTVSLKWVPWSVHEEQRIIHSSQYGHENVRTYFTITVIACEHAEILNESITAFYLIIAWMYYIHFFCITSFETTWIKIPHFYAQ